MKNLWQSISLGRDFTVIFAADHLVRGGRFVRHGKTWRMTVSASETVDPEHVDAAWREVMRKVGSADYCAVTGRIDGTLFFRFSSTELPYAAQRGAVEFELPRRVLRMPSDAAVQFAADTDKTAEGTVGVNVAVIPRAGVEALVGKFEQAGCRIDEYIHPFLAVSAAMPEVMLPEIEPEFYFSGEKWNPMPDGKQASGIVERMKAELCGTFEFPPDVDFDAEGILPLLMAAKIIADGRVHRSPEAFRVLPERVRPVRFRQHIIVSVLLIVLLIAGSVWYFFRTYGGDIRESRALGAELRKLKKETAAMKSSLKRSARELKEMGRVVEMNPGKYDAVRELGLISEILPSNVMVSSMRWGESDIDMVLQCENDKLDVTALIQPLRRWRIAQLQQRQSGDSAVATINLKLAPMEASEKTKKKVRR